MRNHGLQARVQVILGSTFAVGVVALISIAAEQKQISPPISYVGDGGEGECGAETARWANVFPGFRRYHVAFGRWRPEVCFCDAFWDIYLVVMALIRHKNYINSS